MSRQRYNVAAKALHEMSGSAESKLFMELLQNALELVKIALVDCPVADCAYLQGEARAYGKLMRAIAREPLKSVREE